MNRADFIANEINDLSFEDLPEELVERTKDLILDQLGCQLAFSGLEWGQAVHNYVLMHNTQGNSTITRYGEKMGAEDAAICNSVFAHGFEMDDTETLTGTHPGSCMIPTCLSLAEAEKKTGKDVIAAMVAGYETAFRVARLGKTMYHRNWHGTATSSTFGVAASAAKLMDFDVAKTKDALGLAASYLGGNTEYMASGGTVKRTLPSLAVANGMRAAYLTKLGITGPNEPMDGRANVFIGCCDGDPLYEELEVPFKENFSTAGVGMKPYCCCQGSHALIDAAAEIREKINADYKNIKKMTIVFHEREVEILCNIIHPKTIVESQFCARFAIAMRMVKNGNGYYDYCEENLADPDIAELIDKCEVESVPFGTLSDSNGPGRLIVEMNDGTVYDVAKPYASGSIKFPMTRQQVIDKFLSNAQPVAPQEQLDKIIETVYRFDTLTDITELTSLLVVK